MTLQELEEILQEIPYKSTQVILTLGSKQFKVIEVTYVRGEPVELRLEEVKQ